MVFEGDEALGFDESLTAGFAHAANIAHSAWHLS